MSYPPIEGSPKPSGKNRRQSFLDIGGPNSINNFANSYARAQSYIGSTLLERSPSLLINDEISPNTSPLLEGRDEGEVTIDYRLDEESSSVEEYGATSVPSSPGAHGYNHIRSFHFPGNDLPVETSPLFRNRSNSIAASIKSNSISIITGDSTVPQTIFNSINTLMGIAMLTLPYGFKVSGLVLGSLLLLTSAIITNFTAKILGKILHRNPSLNTYGDIAHLFGGPIIAIIVTAIFLVDLTGASLSLILLFSDSFNILLPQISKPVLKTFIVSLLFFLSAFPLSILSIFSLLGVICTLTVILIVIICGFSIDTNPGSLFQPEMFNLWPMDYNYLFLSLGIFMAPWGGHPVFPELYRDMRHPKKFNKSSDVSFSITFILDYGIGIIGLLMYGLKCEDSIIKNLMHNEDYPVWVNPTLCLLMGLLPISKLPLIAKPIITVYENFLGLNDDLLLQKEFNGSSPVSNSHINRHNSSIILFRKISRIMSRAVFCVLLLIVSLLFNSFGKLVSFLGSAICFTICFTLPFMFYLKVFYHEISIIKKLLVSIGIIIGILGSVLGTYAAITLDVDV
ncbi:transmembrane amino acid transporter protein-domain-containing protein [Scheffersomyces coipomensis]|uniref:transmembrane amino acid transporter protein-domain-containing protein n=1 Tax=Scheffersomyces coipomensis TaxID=1788519 RepID=UPI00315DF58A